MKKSTQRLVTLLLVAVMALGVFAPLGALADEPDAEKAALSVTVARSASSVALNARMTFTPTATGGTAPYTYRFILYNGNTRVTSSAWRAESNKRFNYTPKTVGSYRVQLTVKDSADNSVTVWGPYINAGTSLTVKAGRNVASANLNSTIRFTPTVTGGVAPYTYQFDLYRGNTRIIGSAWRSESNKRFNYTPTVAGQYRVSLVVKDAAGSTAAAYSAYIVVGIPLNASVKTSAASVPLGSKIAFTPTASGGVAPYTYKYILYNGSTRVTSSAWRAESNKAFVYTPTSTGNYRVYLTVKDSTGATKSVYSEYITVTEAPALSVTIARSSATATVDSTITFTPTATGGTAPYTYKYFLYNGSAYVTSSALRPEDDKAFRYKAVVAGKYRVKLTVTDSADNTTTLYSDYITVPINTAVKRSVATGTINSTFFFTPVVSGGSPDYQYRYVLYRGNTEVTSSAWLEELNKLFYYRPTEAGKYRVLLTVKDEKGATGSAYSSWITVPLKLTIGRNKAAVNRGQAFTFTPTASGGTAPYTYQYILYRKDINGTTETRVTSSAWRAESNKRFSYTTSTIGDYRVKLTVKDAAGITSSMYSNWISVQPAHRALLVGQMYLQPSNYGHLSGHNDAAAMAAMLAKMSQTPYKVTSLNDLTSDEILAAIKTTFAGAASDDVSLFYFSGFGLNAPHYEQYHGALYGKNNPDNGSSDIVTPTELRTALDTIPGKKIVIIDASYSANFIAKSASDKAAGKAYVDSFINAFARGNKSNLLADDYYVLVSSALGQAASGDKINNTQVSYFTYWLTYGSGYNEGTASWHGTLHADADKNKRLTLDELYDYVIKRAQSSNIAQYAEAYPKDSTEILYGIN